MKKIYMFSGVNKINGFNEKQREYLTKDIKDNMNICFVASTFDNDKNDIYYTKLLEFFKDINITFNKSNLIDKRVNKSDAKKFINDAHIIFLMGGDPYLEMKSIEEYGLKDLIKNKDGIIIGTSAGSMNMSKRVCYEDLEKSKDLIEYDGIGLTDIAIYPHLDFTSMDYLKELFRVSEKSKLIALPNDSFIVITGNNTEFVGDYYIVEDKTINIEGKEYEKINHLGSKGLETERLLLRKTIKSDIDEFFYIQLDPDLRRYLGPTKLGNSLEKNREYFDESKYNDKSYYRWTIIKKEDNKILGTIYLNIHDEKAKTAGIDYWIRKDEWGNGYTTEASKCILNFAFNELKLNRIESCGAKDNVGTWRVMEKIGLKYEGTRKQAKFYYYGGIEDLVLYGLTKEEYYGKNK